MERCFTFVSDFSAFSDKWRNDLKKWCSRLVDATPEIEKLAEDRTLRLVLRYARLSLMLGDHFYSSLDADPKWKSDCSLYANTNKELGGFRQKLDEHLCGVKNIALKVSHYLPAIENSLPHTDIVRALKHKSNGKYSWQDKASAAISKFRLENPDIRGGFILNLAGTGCGKTTANAKIAATFEEEPGTLRFTLALGLRTLTLQTGDEYRDRLHLTNEELAVVIGSGAVQFLHDQDRLQEKLNQNKDADILGGAESLEDLFSDETFFEGELPHEGFATLFKNASASKMLYAPVLCCTIDQIMAATECCRGGRYMLPLLRLMSSDLIIDEVDDFTGNDLKAIGRLIHLCGTLGRKVVLSSATLPPEIARSFFHAYKEGYISYCKIIGKKPDLMAAWLDENDVCVEKISCDHDQSFWELHVKFANRKIDRLKNAVPMRIGYICKCPLESETSDDAKTRNEIYFSHMFQASLALHHNHHLRDPEKGTEISFGVIRFANIDPCVAFAKYLSQCPLQPDTEIRMMVYHSRQTILLRHEQERYLDGILKRHAENPQNPVILSDPLIRKLIDDSHASKILFIVVCSPVEEVGRDHDYDWAVIEPSSWRSIIQMSGRVNRHRQMVITTPNVAIMQYNFKCFKEQDKEKLYYNKPGYENDYPMPSHDLNKLLPSWNGVINAGDRLSVVSDYKSPKSGDNSFAWYEHKVIKRLLLNPGAPDSMVSYPENYWDLSAITQNLSEFRKDFPTINLTLRNCGQNEDDCSFCVQDKLKNWIKVENIYKINNTSLQDMRSFGSRVWLLRDYRASVEKFAELNNLHPNEVKDRFGLISMPDDSKGKRNYNRKWNYSDIFGIYKETNEDFWDD